MWKIILVEDEKPILDLHKRLLEKNHLFKVIAAYASPIEAAKEVLTLDADVILLDIVMPKMSGLELAEKLVEEGIDVPIVFSTAYTKYAVDAFRVQALDYVLKPMTPTTVRQLSERLTNYYGRQKPRSIATLDVSLMGDAQTRMNGMAVKWRTKVTEELFYYLLVNEGKIVSKYQILDDIWPNLDEKKALANLYNTIYHLRKLFIDLNVPIQIERINDGYELISNNAIVLHSPNEAESFLLESKGYLWAYKMNG